MNWNLIYFQFSLAIVAFILALGVSANPNPPHIDGGSVEFNGNWTIESSDDLFYINQTIFLNGNLTIEQEGRLTLINCSLIMNSTSNGIWRIFGTFNSNSSNMKVNGLIDVGFSASINITDSNITFHSNQDSDIGIHAIEGSSLRMVDGTRINFSGNGRPYSINTSGALQVDSCTITGGGYSTLSRYSAALRTWGNNSRILTSDFRNCKYALDLFGTNPLVDSCRFVDNQYSIRLYCVHPTISNCEFWVPGYRRAIEGTFMGTMELKSTLIEGTVTASQGLMLLKGSNPGAILLINNVTLRNLAEGIFDAHDGSTLVEDCIFDNIITEFRPRFSGDPKPGNIKLRRILVRQSLIMASPMAFVFDSCFFNNSTLNIFSCPQGGIITKCSFLGALWDYPALHMANSPNITCTMLDFSRSSVCISVGAGAEIKVIDCRIENATESALDVNASLVSLEGCSFAFLGGNGSRVWGISSHIKMTNCSINATSPRNGYDISALQSAVVILLNTTFNKTSISSSVNSRVEVLWFVMFELYLPWGGYLSSPSIFSLRDANGTEIPDISTSPRTFQLYEFLYVNGSILKRTPHVINIDHPALGVKYKGELVIDSTKHIIIELWDIESPIVYAGLDQRIVEDTSVDLDGHNSLDNDPRLFLKGNFTWSFDEYGTSIILTGINTSYFFSTPGTFEITLTIRDPAGNVASDTMTLMVEDITPPILQFVKEITVPEDVRWIFDASETTDNDPQYTPTKGIFKWSFDVPVGCLTLEGAVITLTFEQPGNYSASLNVYDLAGNMALLSFWVLVLDMTPPTILGVQDMVVFTPSNGLLNASDSKDNVGISGFYWTVTHDNETKNLEGSMPHYDFIHLGIYNVVLRLSDAAGNTNETTISIVYDDIPMLEMPPMTVAMTTVPISVPVRVIDAFYIQLLLRVIAGPQDAFFVGGPNDSKLLWMPPPGNENISIDFEIEVFDGYIGKIERMTIWINPTHSTGNHPPVITSTPPLGAQKDRQYSYTIEADDPDGDRLGYYLEIRPNGMSVNSEGIILWYPPYYFGDLSLAVRLIVTDGIERTIQEWFIRYRVLMNEPPQINFILPDIDIHVREEFTIDLTKYMPDSSDIQIDPDDINGNLTWNVSFNTSLMTIIMHQGLVFKFRALNITTEIRLSFIVRDPSGANDTMSMYVRIHPLSKAPNILDQWFWFIILISSLSILIVIGSILYMHIRTRTS